MKFQDQVILLDPYLSRNPEARPRQPLTPKEVTEASYIFISHGHFDHLMDVPLIASQTKAEVYCSREAADSLEKMGLNRNQIHRISTDRWEGRFGAFHAQAFFSSAGSSRYELELFGNRAIDILLVPLQGHSDICDIAARYVKMLHPKWVIPHHQDDFPPPLSPDRWRLLPLLNGSKKNPRIPG